MSRIGKMPIHLPKGVEVKISDDNELTVKGPLGELHQKVNPMSKLILALRKWLIVKLFVAPLKLKVNISNSLVVVVSMVTFGLSLSRMKQGKASNLSTRLKAA